MNTNLIPATKLSELRKRKGFTEYKQRHCLTCSRMFQSVGPHNRICERCKSQDDPKAWEYPND